MSWCGGGGGGNGVREVLPCLEEDEEVLGSACRGIRVGAKGCGCCCSLIFYLQLR